MATRTAFESTHTSGCSDPGQARGLAAEHVPEALDVRPGLDGE